MPADGIEWLPRDGILSFEEIERLVRLFVELNRFGTTVMIATHDRALIENTRAREMRLIDGRLVEMRSKR